MGCKVEGCSRDYRSLGYCQMHYSRVRETGDPGPVHSYHKKSKRYNPPEHCIVEGCTKNRRALGYCSMHYTRVRREGEPGGSEIRRNNYPPRECQVEGCTDKHNGKGFCKYHYRAFYHYGLTPEDVESMYLQQKNLCKLCQTPLDRSRSRATAIDHCHETGKVRGILCTSCNTSLGVFRESIPLLERVIDYIKNGGDI